MSTAQTYLDWITRPAYQFCSVPPYLVGEITPAELLIMLDCRIPSEQPDKTGQRQRELMDDDTMEKVVSGFLHPVLSTIGGPL